MNRLATFFLSAALAVVCLQASEGAAAGVDRREVGIYVLTVTLLSNGNYLARWDADMGSNGTASGSWQIVGDEIHLTPKKEEGQPMTGYLRVLLLREMDGRRALIRKEDMQNEKNPFFYLYRQKEPNQAAQSTTTAGLQTFGKRMPS